MPNEDLPVGAQHADNFVRNLTTIVGAATAREPRPVTKARAAAPPVVTLDQIKIHLRIEPAVTDEDTMLMQLEAAAHLHTENSLRKPFDETVGEHVKQAMLFLIAHWYRNREAIATGTIVALVPLAYEAILSPERDYPVY